MAEAVEYATTFKFSQQDYDRIFDCGDFFTTSRDGTIEGTAKKLENLSQKEVRLDMHRKTLCNYFAKKIIPRGLRIQKEPTLCRENEQFAKRWIEILNKCSIDLMALIVNEIKTELVTVREEINSTISELKNETTDTVKHDEIFDNINKKKAELEEKLKITKQKKFLRDEQDYKNKEVYSWQKKQNPGSRRPKPRWLNRGNAATSESDYTSDGSSSSRAFLDNRKQPYSHPRGHHIRRQDVARGDNNPHQRQRPRTRSQTSDMRRM